MYRQLLFASLMAISATTATFDVNTLEVDTATFDTAVVSFVPPEPAIIDFTDLGFKPTVYEFGECERLDAVFDEVHEREFDDTRIG